MGHSSGQSEVSSTVSMVAADTEIEDSVPQIMKICQKLNLRSKDFVFYTIYLRVPDDEVTCVPDTAVGDAQVLKSGPRLRELTTAAMMRHHKTSNPPIWSSLYIYFNICSGGILTQPRPPTYGAGL